MKKYLKNNKGFLMLLEIIIVLVIIYFLLNISLKTYFKPASINKQTNKFISQQGVDIDSTNYKAMKDSTLKKVEEINKQYEKQLDSLTNQTNP